MMINKHFGQSYEYLIEADFKNSFFYIHSKHIKTNAVSTITNLNFILSEFENCYNQNDEVGETTWFIKDFNNLKKLWEETNEAFENTNFVLYLERQLEIDRASGGWNSEFNF
ncbi:MAG: hypothetical protein COW71_13190 [Ignavibacteriales bacterium CG18_big_fil_WC_8_21_14_2_50_31_20]|nr:MAG: hypothetical protein COW71_13190 [Ignavibacteriales bacterium CG18_big_fil_WC_8_21_14_2_50_31_20]